MRARIAIVTVLAAAAALIPRAGASAAEPSAYDAWEIKAAMLGKFCEFVRWPDRTFQPASQGSFQIVVLGTTDLLGLLRQVYKGQSIQGAPVVIRGASQISQIGAAQLLFIAAAERPHLPAILQSLRDAPVLTVADTPGFAERGVAINMVRERNRIRFEVNRRALRRASLEASYRLLSLARLVDEAEAP